MASWLPGGSGKNNPSGGGNNPPTPKSVPPPAKPKKRERWLMTRKTWRYMADAGKLLIPEALRKGKDMKDYSDDDFIRLDEHFQRVCDNEREFIEWEGPAEDPRILLAKNRQPRASGSSEVTAVDYRYESLSAKFRLILPAGQTPPPGYVQVGTRRLPVGDIPNLEPPSSPLSPSYENYLRLPSGLIIQELPSAFLTERDWDARRCSSSSPPDSGVLSPDFGDLDYDEETGTPDEGRHGESGIGSGADSVRSKSRHMCVQTEPLPEEFYRIRDEEIRRKEEEERLAREAEERAQRESEELEASMMGDSVMRYLKMVRRNSKNSDQKKAERFRSMNYDPTLRNIKAKYLHKDDDEVQFKTVEAQCDDSILHLLKLCETPMDNVPYFWDRRMSQTSSSMGGGSPPPRQYPGEKDFFSHLYSGDMSALETGSVPEDYYQYLETWYRAQKAIQGPIPSSNRTQPPSSPGLYIPVSTLQNLRSSMPALSSTAAVTSNVSRSTTSLSSHQISPKSLFSSVLGKSSASISKKLRHPGRSKSQSISSASSSWSHQGDFRWVHFSNKAVILEDTNLLLLHELERIALQKLACQKFNTSDLGVIVRIPKDTCDIKHRRKNNILKKRVLPSAKKERPSNPVFGIPLSQCVPEAATSASAAPSQNRSRRKRSSTVEPSGLPDETHSSSIYSRASRSGSRTSFGSIVLDKISSPHHSTGSCESLTTHFEYLRGSDSLTSAAEDLVPSVPNIVLDCIRHVERYGLRTLGIFRVSSSKKRVRQLREAFENGTEGILTEETSVHDVATLLKEFFRDLPEPLIPHEITNALILIQRIKDKSEHIHFIQRLIQILPLANRDTLFILLQFLGLIAENSEDKLLDNGDVLAGNKMDSANLATLFAPNILHSFKTDEKNKSDGMEYITVTKTLIDNREAIFEIPVEHLQDLYVYLNDHFPDLLDALLRRRVLLAGGEEITEEDIREKMEEDTHGEKRSFVIFPESMLEIMRRQEFLFPSSVFQSGNARQSQRGRARRRKNSESSSAERPKLESSNDPHKLTFSIKSSRPSFEVPVSRGSIKFSVPQEVLPPPRRCLTTTTTTISSSKGEAFFGSGQSTPSATDPGSPLNFSPPISPPPLANTMTTPSSEHLILNPVPVRNRKNAAPTTGSVSPPTIVEEEAPQNSSSPSPPLLEPSNLMARRSKTENLETCISSIEKLPSVASESSLSTNKELKRYTRRRYTDSRHPTTELPDVRLEVAKEVSVRKPPVRKPKLTVNQDQV